MCLRLCLHNYATWSGRTVSNLYAICFFTVIPFFNHINLLYGTVCEYCTQISCPVMSAPNNMWVFIHLLTGRLTHDWLIIYRIYYWIDERGRKSKCSAVEYIDRVTASIEKLVRDDAVFPYKHGELRAWYGLSSQVRNCCTVTSVRRGH